MGSGEIPGATTECHHFADVEELQGGRAASGDARRHPVGGAHTLGENEHRKSKAGALFEILKSLDIRWKKTNKSLFSLSEKADPLHGGTWAPFIVPEGQFYIRFVKLHIHRNVGGT
jgi:hypothetical protein